MSQSQQTSVPGSPELHQIDAAQWRIIANQLNDPRTARVVITFLEAHPELLKRHAGTLLRARATVERSTRHYGKGFRLGERLARLIGFFTVPFRGPSRARRGSVRIEPSAGQVELVWPELIRD